MMMSNNANTPPPTASPIYIDLEVEELLVEELLVAGLVVNPSLIPLVVASGRKVGKIADQLIEYPILDPERAVLPAHH